MGTQRKQHGGKYAAYSVYFPIQNYTSGEYQSGGANTEDILGRASILLF